jgi:hypothetical protein
MSAKMLDGMTHDMFYPDPKSFDTINAVMTFVDGELAKVEFHS